MVCFEIRNLTAGYLPGQWVVRIPELDIMAGEITAVLGYSAAGKSTLLNLLGLLDEPKYSNGPYTMRYVPENANYTALSAGEQRRLRCDHFGYIFQDHHLTAHLSALQNVLLPLALAGVSRQKRHNAAAKLLGAAGLGEKATWGALPSELSGGQSLRISVLRALAHSPRVLFADEPTGSLDPASGQKVVSMIEDWYNEDQSRSVILVTHNFHQAIQVAHRFVIFAYGRIVFDGRRGEDGVNNVNDLLIRLPSGLAQQSLGNEPAAGDQC